MRQVSLGPLPPGASTEQTLDWLIRAVREFENASTEDHRGRGQLQRQFHFHCNEAGQCHVADGREHRGGARQLLCGLAQARRPQEHLSQQARSRRRALRACALMPEAA
jgi:hypothetical protein